MGETLIRGHEGNYVNVTADGKLAVDTNIDEGYFPSMTFTRPNNTTGYTALDVVGPSTTANLEFLNACSADEIFMVLGARIRIDINAIPSGMTSFILHLYSSAPTAIADNAAYNLPSADRAKYIGSIPISTITDLGDTVWVQSSEINFPGKGASGSTTLYGLLQTVGAWTPAAQTVLTVQLIIVGV